MPACCANGGHCTPRLIPASPTLRPAYRAGCLAIEIGKDLFIKFNRIRALSDSAARMAAARDAEASELLADKMSRELMAMPLEEALPVLRAFGHYLK